MKRLWITAGCLLVLAALVIWPGSETLPSVARARPDVEVGAIENHEPAAAAVVAPAAAPDSRPTADPGAAPLRDLGEGDASLLLHGEVVVLDRGVERILDRGELVVEARGASGSEQLRIAVRDGGFRVELPIGTTRVERVRASWQGRACAWTDDERRPFPLEGLRSVEHVTVRLVALWPVTLSVLAAETGAHLEEVHVAPSPDRGRDSESDLVGHSPLTLRHDVFAHDQRLAQVDVGAPRRVARRVWIDFASGKARRVSLAAGGDLRVAMRGFDEEIDAEIRIERCDAPDDFVVRPVGSQRELDFFGLSVGEWKIDVRDRSTRGLLAVSEAWIRAAERTRLEVRRARSDSTSMIAASGRIVLAAAWENPAFDLILRPVGRDVPDAETRIRVGEMQALDDRTFAWTARLATGRYAARLDAFNIVSAFELTVAGPRAPDLVVGPPAVVDVEVVLLERPDTLGELELRWRAPRGAAPSESLWRVVRRSHAPGSFAFRAPAGPIEFGLTQGFAPLQSRHDLEAGANRIRIEARMGCALQVRMRHNGSEVRPSAATRFVMRPAHHRGTVWRETEGWCLLAGSGDWLLDVTGIPGFRAVRGFAVPVAVGDNGDVWVELVRQR